MTGRDRFCKRVDESLLRDLTSRELRTRIELLDAELQQLDHDQNHVLQDLYGVEQWRHVRAIALERKAAEAKRERYACELASR